ncbi:MAG: KH domain-containing protein [Synergistaceae bacterium]|jgi:spoIIIJ-associated protein|nr:KH domain-containing protein [Synergistaceae bacterium]
MERTEPLVVETDSIENAVLDAAREWNILPEDVQVRTLEEGKRFLGLFARKTRVELLPSGDVDLLRAKCILSGILKQMGMDVGIQLGEEDVLNVTGTDAGIVIGKYGETLKALEYILNLVTRDGGQARSIRLDSDGYRERREENLKRVALSSAREAVRRRRPVTLEPMTSWERRVVHIALKDHLEVDTRSVGDEPQRRVVIWPRSGSRQKNKLN